MNPSRKPPTIKDVAKAAGVSTMTVSRVLNRPQLVEALTRQRVRAAIRELDYVANEMARQIGTGRRPCIGILSLNVATTPYAVSITLTIEQVAREHGWRTSIVNTFSSDPSAETLDTLFALRPEGVIFATISHRMVRVSDRLLRAGVVLANCQTSQRGVACYVPDDEQGQYEGVLRLLEKGYRRPICIHLPKGAVAMPLRLKGMQRAFQEFQISEEAQTHFVLMNRRDKLPSVPKVKEADYLRTARFLDKALARRPRPDCVICANDRVAFVAYQHLLSLGLRIPKDIGILGFDNMVGVADLFLPPLSTIALPHEEIGKAATLHVIHKQESPSTNKIPCSFVARSSF
ncbi:MAG TPA: LacI family DNA-binding transcriptional regulator [Chthoniobacterales bacterium]|jgi:DNA-binding LacI/PurR family transcriptional regulator|nr:LacI family DNA-binding transcriptional regulator [Chthoniobacterales bacterium]